NGLSSLLSVCTSLRYLNLQRCYLQNCTLKSIDNVSKGLEKLEVLNISQNNLGDNAVAKWLSAINRNQIKSLNLSRVSKNEKRLYFYRIIHDFLIKSSKKLEFLDISHNELDLEEYIQELMSCTSIVDEINVGSNMNIVNLPSLQYHCVKCIC
uniref:Uncharacterized protein n=1 Tax=Ciona savignyi TaxID=51511 RepID=H2ZEH2_CIOSA